MNKYGPKSERYTFFPNLLTVNTNKLIQFRTLFVEFITFLQISLVNHAWLTA